MHDNNLIKLLKTFSKEEFKELGLLIDSPFYNREKVHIKFYSILKKYYPDFNVTELDKKKIFSELFLGKTYNDALLRNTISDFIKLMEEYLKVYQLKKDSFNSNYFLLKELTNRRQQKLFKMNFKKASGQLDSTGIKDEIYYQNNFLLEDEKRRNVVVNSSRVLYADDNLKEQYEHLKVQHMVEMMKLYALMLNQIKFTFDYSYDFSLFETMRKYLEENFHLYRHIPYIVIFYNCVMLYKTEDKKYFERLKTELHKHYRKLTLIDRKNMYMVLTNHCTYQIKHGKLEFYNEMFEVNKEFIRTKAYLEGNDFMAHYIYQTIAMNAILYKKLDWAEKFIRTYRNEISSEFRESSYHYCLANLYLEKKNYDTALEMLSKVEFCDIGFKLNVNLTLLKIYFCKNETEAFLSLVDSFRHFLKRNKEIKNADREFHNNFVNFLKKIYQLKINAQSDTAEVDFLKGELIKNNSIIHKKWLIDNIELLLEKNERQDVVLPLVSDDV